MLNRSALFLASLLAAAAIPAVSSCNAITGAGDLKFREGEGGEDGEGGEGGGVVLENLPPASGVTITAIDLYQGIKRPLMQAGAPAVSDVPIVANRNAMVRVFVSTDAAYNGSTVTARLHIGLGGPIEVKKAIPAQSTEDVLDSTFNFDVPGTRLVAGMANYRVELLQSPADAPSGSPGAHYPAMGTEAIQVQDGGQTLKLVLVPVQYGFDGSNRLPDTTEEQVKAYQDLFLGMYPVPSVQVTIHDPMPYAQAVSAIDGYEWSYLLEAVVDLRQQDKAAADVYYYGIFAPAETENQYCSQGCILGLANLAGEGDSYMRAGIGVGFTGKTATETAVHEVGHTHGRQHAPCGNPDGVDFSFPYETAGIGVFGYSIVTKELFSPTTTKDVMSYCTPYWPSDYTYKALFTRIQSVNKPMTGTRVAYPESMLDQVYMRARIDDQGELSWMTPVTLHTPPVGAETKTVTMETDTGSEAITGQYYPYDHIGGGILVWRESERPISTVKVNVAGKLRTLNP